MVKILFCFLHFSVTVNLFLHFNNNQFGPYYFQLIINFTNGKCLHSKWCVLLAHSFSFISIFYVVSLLSSFFFIYDLSHFFSFFVLVHLDNFWPYRALFFPYYSSWMETSRAYCYCSGIHLDNFLSYRALSFLLFIMNGDFYGFFYCAGLSFYIKCSGPRQATFINTEFIVESLESFRKF